MMQDAGDGSIDNIKAAHTPNRFCNWIKIRVSG